MSKYHWVMDFHRDAPHIPLVGPKTSLHDICVFGGCFSFKNRSSGPELLGRTLDIHMTISVIDGFYMHM